MSALLIVLGGADRRRLSHGAHLQRRLHPLFAAPSATLTLADVANPITRAGQRRGWWIRNLKEAPAAPGPPTSALYIGAGHAATPVSQHEGIPAQFRYPVVRRVPDTTREDHV